MRGKDSYTTAAACQDWEFFVSLDDSIEYSLLLLQVDKPIYSKL